MVQHQILVFGFNRPEMIERRLDEALRIAPPNVFVSIDYKDDVISKEMQSILEKYRQIWPSHSSLTYRLHTENQGLVSHLTQTITECLENYECAVVIEDDVAISQGFYESANVYMKSKDLRSRYATFGGFSFFPHVGFLERYNFYRPTPYFACWGWVITRENWSGYKTDLSSEDVSNALLNSGVWNRLNKKQQNTWRGRFNKAKSNPSNTWDIQFQYHSFKIDKLNLAPVMRLVDNQGYNDVRGSHTQHKRPVLLGQFKFAKNRVNNLILPVWAANFFVYIESVLFFEDLWLPPTVKKIAKNLFKR